MSEHTDDAAAGRRRRRGGKSRRKTRPRGQMRTVHEYSAGGLVVDGIDDEALRAVVIGHADRKGHMMWCLPKGHVEVGERPEETALREITEETGVYGDILALLGYINYWFRADEHIVHKTVRHYLVRFRGGQLCAGDHEVGEVAWVPLDQLHSRLAHDDERKLAATAITLIDRLRADGATALPPLPPSSPRRQPQTHSIARRHTRDANGPTGSRPRDQGVGDDADHRDDQ